MNIVYLENKERLNNFLIKQKNSEFLQSFEWINFLSKAKNKIFRLGVKDKGELVAVISMVKMPLGIGKSYLYAPRGPVVNSQFSISNFQTIFNFLILEIKKIAEKDNILFLRIEPSLKIENCKLKIIKSIDLQPAQTSILGLDKTEDELLAAMHQKTRYNIRLAEKKGVVVRKGSGEDFEKFWEIMSETSQRDGFRLHTKEHYEKMIALDNIELYAAFFENRIIAGVIISFFGDTAVYAHGASSGQYRNKMAPYLLQWHAILQAKAAGKKFYDFFGTNDKKWPGVTRFKKGFGGVEKNYAGTHDLVFNPVWYNGYILLRKIRRFF